MASTLLLAAGVLCVVTALIHSALGEKRLIKPLLANEQGVMSVPLARQVIRLAWHWTTLLWFLVAAVLISGGLGNQIEKPVLLAIGGTHFLAGLLDALITRGKHIGWPFITLIGVLTLLAVFQS